MNNISIEEVVQQLKTGKPVCVCKPFCGHWEAHAAKVLSKYLPDTETEEERFRRHLKNASELAATWQPWERHIFSSAPCGVQSCPCQDRTKENERGVLPCRCGSIPEIKWQAPEDHCPEGYWMARCTKWGCGIRYYGLTRLEAIEYWNNQQIDVEPYPFGRVGKNESDNTERR